MTKISITQNTPILVAIDIAKARHEVLIAIPGRKRRRGLTVLNQLGAFQRLITTLASYGFPVQVAFEATGNDHRAIAYHLAAAARMNRPFFAGDPEVRIQGYGKEQMWKQIFA